MNEAAEMLGIDRVEIRLRNLPERGQSLSHMRRQPMGMESCAS